MLKTLILSTLAAGMCLAQVNVGSISGTITDPSGASVPEATITLTNEETGVAATTRSTAAGNYLFTPLQRGMYRIAVRSTGFKETQRGGLELQVGEKLGVNLALEVGNVAEVLEVKAESPLLTTTQASIGQVVNHQKIMELPLPGRDPTRLFQIAPGVGGTTSTLGDLRLGGGRTRLVEFYVDGSPTSSTADQRSTALPSIDAIEELKVETNNLSAEYGRTSGGAINIQTRAGTNAYHGSLYLFEQGDIFNANDWNSNRRGFAKAGYQLHQFGLTLGGPIQFPKIYDGHNKTFFFFNYDGGRTYQDGSTQTATMPTALERGGDFSQTLNANAQKITIYDPSTYSAATNTRLPFAGNVIPTTRFDPVAKYLLSLWAIPNRTPDVNGTNNYQGVSSSQTFRNDFTGRLDQNIGSNHRLYLRLTHKQSDNYPSNWAGPATSGVRPSWETQSGSTFNWSWTARPTMIVSAQLGMAPRDFIYYPVFDNFDPTQIPFAANAKSNLDPRFIPLMSFEKISGLGVNFGTTWLHDRYFFGNISMTKIWNRHTLKIGYEQRRSYLNDSEAGAPSGGASFDGAWTGLNQQAPLAQQGSGFASFLLGTPNTFTFDGDKLGWAVLFANHGLYFQDDYKVRPRLTLNLGLRWEYEAPETERFNRVIYVDPKIDNGFKVNPNYNFQRDVIAAGALPAGSPAPNLNGPLLGGVGLVNSAVRSSRGGTDAYYKNIGPRLGLAYQITPKTVFRSGFGILYSGYTGNASGVNSVSLNTYTNATGAAVITPDGGRTIAATLSNPFPNNVGLNPALTTLSDITNKYMGNLVFGYEVDHRPSYEISYNAGFQHQLGNWLFEGSFVGNAGRHLYVGGNPFVNTLDPQYLSQGANLDKQVANPFYGMMPANNASPLAQPTIAYKYLLNPMPYWPNGLRSLQRSTGRSQYTAGMFRVERRLSRGLSVLVSYTVSKLIEDTAAKTSSQYGLPQDGKTFSDLRGISVQDIPQKLVLTYLYELPIGRGHKLLGSPRSIGEKLFEKVAGGWKVAGFSMFQSGYPLQIRQTDNYTGGLGYGNLRPTLAGDYRSSASIADATGAPAPGKPTYVNLSAFQVTSRFAFGTTPQVLPNYRQPRYNQTDLAIMKDFRFAEHRYVQVRLESSNFFNHPVFQLDANAQNIQRAEFGYFQSQLNSPRNIQFGARFVF